jgi:hypothetical protein
MSQPTISNEQPTETQKTGVPSNKDVKGCSNKN